MKQLLEFLPLVLFYGAYQMDGEIVTVGSWSHTFDGIFSATAVLMASSVIVWLLASALSRQNQRRLMWMAFVVVVFGAATSDSERPTVHSMEAHRLQLGAGSGIPRLPISRRPQSARAPVAAVSCP
jgi:heme/copper-type cytochrome/quinol oxidase subunit 3